MALGKTVDLVHLSTQGITTGTTVRSSAINLSTALRWALDINLMRASGTAFASAAAAPRVLVYGSTKATGDDDWSLLYEHLMQVGASIGSTSITSYMNSTTIIVGSGTNFATRELIGVGSSTGFELKRLDAISGTQFTLQVPLQNSYMSTTPVIGQAENPCPTLDVEGFRRGLVVVQNQASGQSINVSVLGSYMGF